MLYVKQAIFIDA